MKTFTHQAAQGDLLLIRVDLLPEGAVLNDSDPSGHHIVGHSETGHHHVIDADRVTMYRLPEDLYECFLVVRDPAELKHQRPHDTHETILVPPGTYQVRRQRERAYTPEGWRRAQD